MTKTLKMDAWLLTWIILPTSKMDVDQVTAILDEIGRAHV